MAIFDHLKILFVVIILDFQTYLIITNIKYKNDNSVR